MSIGTVASSIACERPPLKLKFSDGYYCNENFTADTGQFTQFSIGGTGTFSVTGGQGVFTNASGSQKDRFISTGTAINNPIGWFQVDVVSVSGTPNNWNIGAVGMAKNASNGIWAEHDALNNQTRIDVRIGGAATVLLINQTITAPYSLALSVYKNHLECYTKSGSTWSLQLMYDIPSSTIDLTTTDLSTWFPNLGASASSTATATWTYDNFVCYSTQVNPFELLPSNLISVTEPFNADTGQFTKLSPSTPATFSIVSNQGKFANPNNAIRQDFYLEGADVAIPQVCSQITFVSQTNDGGTPTSFDGVSVGICKDTSNFLWAHYDRIAAAVNVRMAVAGTITNNSQVSVTTFTFPFKLALSIVANRATVWVNQGSSWQALTNYDFSAKINFKTASMTGWKGAFAVETNNNSDWVVDDFFVGRFGTVGIRDQSLVTLEDGTPYTSGTDGYFTATCLDPNGVGYMGVFKYNLTSRLITQTGVIMSSRSSNVQNDLSGNIIKFNSNADSRLIISSWGNGFGGTLQVLMGTATATDLCIGTHTVTVSAFTLPGHVGGGGEYDAFAVKIGSTWYLAYTITTDTSFAGNTFYSAVASSTDLSTWSQVGSPDSGNQGFEGTKIHKTHNGYFVYSGGHTSARCYDLLTFTFQGLLNIVTTGGTDTFPHPMIFPNGNKQVFLSFDNVKFNGVTFTWGNLRIYEANRLK